MTTAVYRFLFCPIVLRRAAKAKSSGAEEISGLAAERSTKLRERRQRRVLICSFESIQCRPADSQTTRHRALREAGLFPSTP